MDKRGYWILVLSASLIIMITMGVRLSLGLYVSPINSATGLGIVAVSFALAVGQFMWGAAQPVFGALLDRAGTVRILVIGALMMAVLRNGSNQSGWPTYFQEIIIGVVIIIAVGLDKLRQGRAKT